MNAALAGFSLGFSLILAIGAQNAFVLRQGLRREHVLAVVLTCALSDALLIAAGVAGFGALAGAAPWLAPVMLYGAVHGAAARRWRPRRVRRAHSVRCWLPAFSSPGPTRMSGSTRLCCWARWRRSILGSGWPSVAALSPPPSCSSSRWATARGSWPR